MGYLRDLHISFSMLHDILNDIRPSESSLYSMLVILYQI